MFNKKIGILTWHYFHNFGSVLQAYALQKTIKGLGYQVEIINYRKTEYNGKNMVRKMENNPHIFYLVCKICGRYSTYSFSEFARKYLNQTKPYFETEKLKKCLNYSSIVVGSDQIWAPNVFDPVYMLNFVDSATIKKISYAASIGLNNIPVDLRNEYSRLLSDFSHISVREKDGADLLKRICNVNAEVVLDPTLLLDVKDYTALEKPVKNINKPYAFCYFLNADNNYKKKVEDFCNKKNLKIIGVSANIRDSEWMLLLNRIVGPSEFLWLIHNSDVVFTDSYHGTIFSLLYGKLFYTFMRFTNDDPVCQNSRIRQLENLFNIEDLVIENGSTIDERKSMNYDRFKVLLDKYKNKSIEYIKEALL